MEWFTITLLPLLVLQVAAQFPRTYQDVIPAPGLPINIPSNDVSPVGNLDSNFIPLSNTPNFQFGQQIFPPRFGFNFDSTRSGQIGSLPQDIGIGQIIPSNLGLDIRPALSPNVANFGTGSGPTFSGAGQVPVLNFGQALGSGPADSLPFRQSITSVPQFQIPSKRIEVISGRPVFGSQVNRVDNFLNPTITQVVTIDRFVTLTDTAFNSVAVTLTSLIVQTVTTGTTLVLSTPINDRIALQTSVVLRPSSVTLTEVKSDFRIATEVSIDHVTITHTSYIIKQFTYTTTATQILTYTSTLVRTNVNTERSTITDYLTVTDTVYVQRGYGSLP
nr:uncharacterized protein LOC128686700 [Cherax quadricarinatus]